MTALYVIVDNDPDRDKPIVYVDRELPYAAACWLRDDLLKPFPADSPWRWRLEVVPAEKARECATSTKCGRPKPVRRVVR